MTARLANYINGSFSSPVENAYLENINPCDGSVISLIPDSTAIDVHNAVLAGKEALECPSWNFDYVTMKQRSGWLNKIADGIEAKLDLFARAESLDTGTLITTMI
jgi:aminomuconate-semialdehyde/2-hydroxymuconate-6-semialdehyde dehydrogenase